MKEGRLETLWGSFLLKDGSVGGRLRNSLTFTDSYGCQLEAPKKPISKTDRNESSCNKFFWIVFLSISGCVCVHMLYFSPLATQRPKIFLGYKLLRLKPPVVRYLSSQELLDSNQAVRPTWLPSEAVCVDYVFFLLMFFNYKMQI